MASTVVEGEGEFNGHHNANLAAMRTLCHNLRMSRLPPLPLPVRAQLFQHLAAMEKAGLPADRSYALLQLGPEGDARASAFRRQFAKGIDPVTAGSNCGLFTLFETRLLRAAFAGGSPYPTYDRLAKNLAIRVAQQRTLRARMVLPAGILTVALFVQPLPKLFNGDLSSGGYALQVFLPLAVIAAVGVIAVRIAAWFATGESAPWRPALERMLLAMPVCGRLHLRRNARDFAESLALLLGAGLPLFEAIPLATAVDNHIVRDDLAVLLPALQSGATLSQAISRLRVVETFQLFAIVHTGEESGTLPEMLARHAEAESDALAQAQEEIVNWLPRILYGCVALWMVSQLLGPVLRG
jgi:general secretion pathway protein F